MIVKKITYNDCLPFILNIHYARRIPCIQYAFGLFDNDKLIGVCTFGQPASPSLCKGIAGETNRKNVLELNRLVLLPEHNGKNNSSILISKSLKMLPKNLFVVSYADIEGWGHVGYVYQATNWLYTGKTKSRTNKYSDGHSRHYDKNETRRQYRTAKYRYVYLTGNKKKQLKELKYTVITPYPKGDNVKYDHNKPIPLNLREDIT